MAKRKSTAKVMVCFPVDPEQERQHLADSAQRGIDVAAYAIERASEYLAQQRFRINPDDAARLSESVAQFEAEFRGAVASMRIEPLSAEVRPGTLRHARGHLSVVVNDEKR